MKNSLFSPHLPVVVFLLDVQFVSQVCGQDWHRQCSTNQCWCWTFLLSLSLAHSFISWPILLLLLRYIDNFICVYYFLSLQFYSVWLLYLFDTFVSLVDGPRLGRIRNGATKNGRMCVLNIASDREFVSRKKKQQLYSIKMDRMDQPTCRFHCLCECFFVSGCVVVIKALNQLSSNHFSSHKKINNQITIAYGAVISNETTTSMAHSNTQKPINSSV